MDSRSQKRSHKPNAAFKSCLQHQMNVLRFSSLHICQQTGNHSGFHDPERNVTDFPLLVLAFHTLLSNLLK